MPRPTELVSAELVEAKARYNLPKEMSAGIGRIVTRWSYAEERVQRLLYEMIGVDDTVGRIAIREPRLTDRMAMVLDLLAADGVQLSSDLLSEYKTMYKQADTLSGLRDLCVHGTWSYSGQHKSWCVTNTRGQWEPDAQKHGISGKKRIKPEGRLHSPDDLNEIAEEIEGLIDALGGLFVVVGIAYHASRETPPPQPDL